MEKSISDIFVLTTVAFALFAALIVIWYLVREPPLTSAVKLLLFAGIFVLPIISATSGNVAGFKETQHRSFCAGCHVMLPYTHDASDPNSSTLASQHARNQLFGESNCYNCHKEYAMFGAVTTKLVGMKHAWYYGTQYLGVPIEDALGTFAIYEPYPNKNCMYCHSTKLSGFVELEDHFGAIDDIRSGQQSCVSEGCHGPVHPFGKVQKPKGLTDD